MGSGGFGFFLFYDGYGRDGPGCVRLGRRLHEDFDVVREVRIAVKPARLDVVILKLD